MSLQIGQALRSGKDDLFSEDGLLIAGVFLLFNIGNQVASSSFTKALFSSAIDENGQAGPGGPAVSVADMVGPFSLDLALPITIVLMAVFLIVNQLVKFWGIRLFAGPEAVLSDDDSGRAIMAVLLGGGLAIVVFALSMSSSFFQMRGNFMLGIVLSLVSGLVTLILGLTLVYLRQSIALYDGGYVDTVKHSFARFMDSPAEIIVLLFVLFLLSLIAGIPATASFVSFFLPSSVALPSQSVLQVTSLVLNAPVQAFSLAVITDAYLQVRADQTDDEL